MNLQSLLSLLFIITTTLACNNVRDFPELKNLNQFEQTEFIPTLESKVNFKKNSIYAASLLMVWDEVKNEISEPIINFGNKELQLMNNSKSYINVFKESEYNSSVVIEDSRISAKAYFQKSLAFEFPYERYNKSLKFLKEEVSSFGFDGHNESCKILYYKNDNDFAIKLLPKDIEHEIILIKSKYSNHLILKNEINKLNKKSTNFNKRRNDKNHWKYYFNDDDKVRIPVVEFNIETNYSNILGSLFNTKNRVFEIESFYQRTAFIIDEKGAKVESEASIVVEAKDELEKVKPKKLFFDKTYIILMKRVDSEYPYFATYIANSDLMLK